MAPRNGYSPPKGNYPSLVGFVEGKRNWISAQIAICRKETDMERVQITHSFPFILHRNSELQFLKMCPWNKNTQHCFLYFCQRKKSEKIKLKNDISYDFGVSYDQRLALYASWEAWPTSNYSVPLKSPGLQSLGVSTIECNETYVWLDGCRIVLLMRA